MTPLGSQSLVRRESMNDNSAKLLDQDQGEDEADEEAPPTTRDLLEKQYNVNTQDITSSESLIFVILDLAVNQHYDRAIKELRGYLNYKSTYPTYRARTERLFDHIINVINAIRTKKSLALVATLTASKRKELGQAIAFHFQDLKKSLQKVTQIELQLKLKDSRSTVWVVNTLIVCVVFFVIFLVVREALESMRAPLEIVQQDVLRWLYKALDY